MDTTEGSAAASSPLFAMSGIKSIIIPRCKTLELPGSPCKGTFPSASKLHSILL